MATPKSSSNVEEQEAQAYPYPYTVNVSNFVSVKLSGQDKYQLWKTQMMCLIEGHDMLGFIDGSLEPPSETKPARARWKRSDALVRGWIQGSVSEDVLASTIGLKTAKDVWTHLETRFVKDVQDAWTSVGTPKAGEYGDDFRSIFGGWKFGEQPGAGVGAGSDGLLRSTRHSLSLPSPLRGVSQRVDLKGDSAMPAFGDRKMNSRFRKSRGLRSRVLTEESWEGALLHSLDLAETTAGQQEPNFENGTEQTKNTSYYLPLYKAALRGNWEEAEEFINQDEESAMADVNKYGFTALHIAVGAGKQGIRFVENLVEKISPIELPNMLTSSEKYTPLDIAAVVGNTEAVKILAKKNEKLLYAEDADGLLPIHRALFNSHKDTFLYLLEVTKGDQEPCVFAGEMGVTLLSNVIFAGYFDIALDLVTRYPDLATTIPSGNIDAPLMAIARKADAFESESRLNFFDSIIYKYAPAKLDYHKPNKKPGEVEKQAKKSQAPKHKAQKRRLFGWRHYFNAVLQVLYFMVWAFAGTIAFVSLQFLGFWLFFQFKKSKN